MHPEITRELMRAQHEELARQSRRPASRYGARPGATNPRARGLRRALRHASHLTHGAH